MRSRSAAAINSARMLRLGRTRTEIRRTRWCCKEAPRRARVLADLEDLAPAGWADLGRAAPAAKLGLARRAMQRRLRAPAEVRRGRAGRRRIWRRARRTGWWRRRIVCRRPWRTRRAGRRGAIVQAAGESLSIQFL